jgi:hypothetical protein
MNSVYIIVGFLAAIVLMGSTGASLLQQTSAIIDNWREEFRVLTDEFEDAVSDVIEQKPVNNDTIQTLVEDYKTNLTKIFEGTDNDTSIV